MRKAWVLLFGLILLASPSFGTIDKITVSEGSLIKLKIDAYDLDDDELIYYFPEPFDKDGKWQTDYDDAGVYNFTIAVGDGKEISYRQVQITVKDKDQPPVFIGLDNSYTVKETETLRIELNATDADGDDVEFIAVNLPDGSSFSEGVFEWTPDYNAVSKEDTLVNKVLTKIRLYNLFKQKNKEFTIVFVAKGKEEGVKKNVKISVKDTNRAPVFLEDMEDIVVYEGETINIKQEAFDPDGDVLTFSYSGFMSSRSYQTDYDDAGEYELKVTVSDGKDEVSQEINITVKNKNRGPELNEIKDKIVYENQMLKFGLVAKDKDNDEINYSAEHMPDGADLTGNVFTYTPDFDVTDDSKIYIVTFVAADSEAESRQSIKLTVKDVNRRPVIKDFSDITVVYVNDAVKFSVDADDPDGDNLTYKWIFGMFSSYSGGSTHIRTFTTTGRKTVKLLISDGQDTIVQKWKVDINAKKVIKKTETKPKIYKTYTINK